MVKTKRLEVLFDNVLLKPVDKKKQTDGGILLPESVDQGVIQYEVVQVGEDIITAALGVGQIVFVKADHKGTKITLEGQEFLVVCVKDVAAMLQGD